MVVEEDVKKLQVPLKVSTTLYLMRIAPPSLLRSSKLLVKLIGSSSKYTTLNSAQIEPPMIMNKVTSITMLACARTAPPYSDELLMKLVPPLKCSELADAQIAASQ